MSELNDFLMDQVMEKINPDEINRLNTTEDKFVEFCEEVVLKSKIRKYQELVMNNSDAVYDFCKDMIGERKEKLRVILFDPDLYYIDHRDYCSFSSHYTSVDPLSIIKYAILNYAAQVIIVHNHATEGLEFSDGDVVFTINIMKIAKKMRVELFDHLLINKKSYISFTAAYKDALDNIELNFVAKEEKPEEEILWEPVE